MSGIKSLSPSIYLIADHLDAVLAYGEDLIAMSPPAEIEASPPVPPQLRRAGQRMYLEGVRATETKLLARVMRAREHAEQVRRVDSRLDAITNLFVSATHVVADAAAEFTDTTALDFQTGRDSIAYLRSRGLIGDDATAFPAGAELKITEAFVLAATVELGAVLDLAAAFLDALELHYDLFGDTTARPAAPSHEQEAPITT